MSNSSRAPSRTRDKHKPRPTGRFLYTGIISLLLLACNAEAPVLLAPTDTEGNAPLSDTQGGPDSKAPTDTDTNAKGPCTSNSDCAALVKPCQNPICENGTCTTVSTADNSPCDDGDLCTLNDSCQTGSCEPGSSMCDDGNPCTLDQCGEEGCLYAPSAGGCDDGNPCTLADHCVNGLCQAGNSVCVCNEEADCADWEDGNPCNGTLTCSGGVCQILPGSVISCPTGVAGACSLYGCIPETGACGTVLKEDGVACTDEQVCTTPDTCQAGVCNSGPSNCACTDDASCLAFDDGNLCNGILRCAAGQCVPDPSSVVVCASTSDPCAGSSCDPATGECSVSLAETAPCDDGNPCTTADQCLNQSCQGSPKLCNDNNPCTDDACAPNGECLFVPNGAACTDGNDCTLGDQCAGGICVAGVDECSCSKNEDCLPFEDGDPCTGTLACMNNICLPQPGTVVVCDPSVNTDCAVNTCLPGQGICQLIPVNDGSACFDADPCTEGEFCHQGQCIGDPSSCSCNPGEGLSCGTQLLWANDAFGSTKNVDAWSCAPGDYSGSEYAWPFQVNQPTSVTVKLSNEEAATDLFVLEDQGNGCTPSSCVTAAVSKLTFVAQPGVLYYVVVDGKKGSTGKFDLSVDCLTAIEVNCEDGTDDDNDGAFDCNDPDCSTDLACAGGEFCSNGIDDNNNDKVDCQDPACASASVCTEICYESGSAYCGLSTFWQTGGFASDNNVSSYNCVTQQMDGPEVAYSFNATTSNWVTVKLINGFIGHNILILQEQGSGCNGTNCLTAGFGEVSFYANAGVKYYLVIDGALGSVGSYQLKIDCQ